MPLKQGVCQLSLNLETYASKLCPKELFNVTKMLFRQNVWEEVAFFWTLNINIIQYYLLFQSRYNRAMFTKQFQYVKYKIIFD